MDGQLKKNLIRAFVALLYSKTRGAFTSSS